MTDAHLTAFVADAGSLGSAYRDYKNNLRVTVFHANSENEEEQVEVVERRPSPYYYSDLLNHDDSGPSAFKSYRKPEDIKTSTISSNYYCKTQSNPRKSEKEQKPGVRGLESYHPFSAKENFEPKQGGLGFYDFASGKTRKKHRVVEVKGNLSEKKHSTRKKEVLEENEVESIPKEQPQDDFAEVKKRENNFSNGSRRKEYVKSVSLDVPSLDKNSLRKRGCRKSASLDIPLREHTINSEIGESSNRFRPIVPVKETEEGIEGGDEEEEEVKREKRKSLKKLPQIYNYNYRDCLTGAPKKHFPKNNEFSPAEVLQHVIHSGGDSKSLLAACLAEWDAHARLMRPLTARTLTQCACATGAQKQCVSSDDEEDCQYQYSRDPFPTSVISRGEFIRSQESLRRREFLKEPIPDGENLGDEFVKGQRVDSQGSEESTEKNTEDAKKSLNAEEIYQNWGIVVEDEGGFENWNQGYDDNSDSVEAYRIAKEIVKETENWQPADKKLTNPLCRSTESLYDLEDMNRRGLLYETAFDCKISRSDDDLDELDRVTNHPVLHSRLGRSKSAAPAAIIESYSKPPRPGSSFARGRSIYTPKDRRKSLGKTSEKEACVKTEDITDRLQNIALVDNPTPPSTAPLPSKFCGHDDFIMNSIKSAPELPISSPAHLRLKDTRLPVKSLRARDTRPKTINPNCVDPSNDVGCDVASDKVPDDTQSNELLQNTNFTKPKSLVQSDGLILEFKGRPEGKTEGKDKKLKVSQRPRSLMGEIRPVLEFKGNQRRNGRLKFSSTESMATSSSGGSLESIKSSTSEGNRSTSSSESHRSSSLSSHSSDSMGNVVAITAANLQFHLQKTNPHHQNHNNKMHILSPISDKSSVEPASEMSDNNKNNNSQKPSPEDHEQTNGVQHNSTKPDLKLKRRALQNKNLINLGLQMSSSSGEAQGSDSGISIESRTPRSSGLSASGQTEVGLTFSMTLI